MGGDVIGEIHYLTSTTDDRPPWRYDMIIPAEVKSNFIETPTPMTMHDLRGKETSVNLDTNGFEVVKYTGTINEAFEKGTEEQKICYQEMADFMKKHLGASRVIFFHHACRIRSTVLPFEMLKDAQRNPIFYPHADFTAIGAREHTERKLGKEETDSFFKNRFQLLNIWRPLGKNPVTDRPLTLCDYSSVDMDNDAKVLTIYGPGENYSSYSLARNAQDAHKWYYISRMRSDEMYIFKTYDSKPGVAQCAFHTAFKNVNEPSPTEEEKSIEMRCFVAYDE